MRLADRRRRPRPQAPARCRGLALREARPTLGGGMPLDGAAAAAKPAPILRRLWPGLQESSKKARWPGAKRRRHCRDRGLAAGRGRPPLRAAKLSVGSI